MIYDISTSRLYSRDRKPLASNNNLTFSLTSHQKADRRQSQFPEHLQVAAVWKKLFVMAFNSFWLRKLRDSHCFVADLYLAIMMGAYMSLICFLFHITQDLQNTSWWKVHRRSVSIRLENSLSIIWRIRTSLTVRLKDALYIRALMRR